MDDLNTHNLIICVDCGISSELHYDIEHPFIPLEIKTVEKDIEDNKADNEDETDETGETEN